MRDMTSPQRRLLRESPELQRQLRALEREYWEQPPYIRRRDLQQINSIRTQLGMPQVDNNLQPIAQAPEAPTPQPPPAPPAPPQETPYNPHQQRVMEYAVQNDLDMPTLRRRIREYAGVNIPYNQLDAQQAQKVVEGLQREYENRMLGRRLSQEYNDTSGDKRTHGFSLATINQLRCSHCGQPFPLEGMASPVVPWIRGGLIFMVDDKGAPLIYHGYMGRGDQNCFARAQAAENNES